MLYASSALDKNLLEEHKAPELKNICPRYSPGSAPSATAHQITTLPDLCVAGFL